MGLRTKWLLVSVVGAVLIPAVFLFVLIDMPIGVGIGVPRSLEALAKVVLWPIALCLYLSGPGPNVGSAEKHLHEWTPVQDFALVAGIGLSWAFYSSIVFLLIWFQHKRRMPKTVNS
jgi:predicted Na+-dependent transporter